ncbi:hypothetical protein ACHAWF_006781 [Thalassiosira exigua]
MSPLPRLSPTSAAEEPARSSTAVAFKVPMKCFVDTTKPSLFVIDVPQRFFSIRQMANGDLLDAKTGQGWRGGTIFTAEDMSKAEVIAMERRDVQCVFCSMENLLLLVRFPARTLLEDEGYEVTGNLSTFFSIGNSVAIATLLLQQREKDKLGTQNVAVLNHDSVEINAEKPELLMERLGISELFQTTVVKATLGSNDNQLMAV